jgi:hypothetical protein
LAVHPIGRLLRLAGCSEDGFGIVLQDLELSAATHNAKEGGQIA